MKHLLADVRARMAMNLPMRLLMDQVDVAQAPELSVDMAALLADGFVEQHGCVFLRGCCSDDAAPPSQDPIGEEALVNKVYVAEGLSDTDPMPALLQGLVYLVALAASLRGAGFDGRFLLILGLNGTDCHVRFHRIRPGSTWLADDLEGFQEPVLTLVVDADSDRPRLDADADPLPIRTAEEFIKLRTSEAPDDYRRASSASASLEVWEAIVAHHPAMRFWVAQNKTVPLDILRLLAKDTDERVREMVARKRKIDRGIFDLLACDPSDRVRQGIACNPKAPIDIIQRLTRDACRQVREAAQARLATRDGEA